MTMTKKVYCLLTFVLFSFGLKACLNYYYSLDKEGHLIPIGLNWHDPFKKNFNIEKEVKRLKLLNEKLKKEKSYTVLSDYSVVLMKLGKYKEALEILRVLYDRYPSEYQLASNLGTAYELNGVNDSALKYIRRGMLLNPQDHEGSEWIHAKILEMKLNLKVDPNHLQKNALLDLNEKQKRDSIVLQQINIQLKERVPFSPGPDPIMAALFTDMGDISANIRSIEYARAYYLIAQNYYGGDKAILGPKIREMQKLMSSYAAVYPKEKRTDESQNMKLGYFRYEELLIDNSKPRFQPNWKELTTDPVALLALVDLPALPSNKGGGDTLSNRQTAAQTPGVSEPERESSGGIILIYIGTGIIVLGAMFIVLIKNRK
jgi:tetratricopeptide (TPR) repeat protein